MLSVMRRNTYQRARNVSGGFNSRMEISLESK